LAVATRRPGTYIEDQNSGFPGRIVTKTLPLTEVKTRLPELVAGVDEREEEVVVTKNGRPAAILVNVDEYRRIKETLDVLSDPALLRQVAESRAFYRAGRRGLSFEDVFGEPVTPPSRKRPKRKPA
jgi:prevent-host-death family protein